MRDTFLLSNAVPQRAEMNSGKWNQLEKRIRALLTDSDFVYVVTGPLFENNVVETIGQSEVAVPSHVWKVALAIQAGRKVMYAAIVPNESAARQPHDELCGFR